MLQVSLDTLDALSRRVATNKSWFDTYFRANTVNLDRDASRCNGECRKVQTCAISNIDYASVGRRLSSIWRNFVN